MALSHENFAWRAKRDAKSSQRSLKVATTKRLFALIAIDSSTIVGTVDSNLVSMFACQLPGQCQFYSQSHLARFLCLFFIFNHFERWQANDAGDTEPRRIPDRQADRTRELREFLEERCNVKVLSGSA